MQKSAVVLLSGGLDSAVTLAEAKRQGFRCLCLIFDYGQRHRKEIEAAKKISRLNGCSYRLIKMKFPWKGSVLLDKMAEITKSSLCRDRRGYKASSNIPDTYVPARNIIFLSLALSCAEAVGATAIFIGAHAQDYSGYPDCRPEFFRAFEKVISCGTKAGVKKTGITIKTPVLNKSKSEIIKMGLSLGVNFALTWSCYKGGKSPCGKCDSCYFRRRGFQELGILDPARPE